jgi:hypothetical protein
MTSLRIVCYSVEIAPRYFVLSTYSMTSLRMVCYSVEIAPRYFALSTYSMTSLWMVFYSVEVAPRYFVLSTYSMTSLWMVFYSVEVAPMYFAQSTYSMVCLWMVLYSVDVDWCTLLCLLTQWWVYKWCFSPSIIVQRWYSLGWNYPSSNVHSDRFVIISSHFLTLIWYIIVM